ncbi:MAG: alpha/beta hydrolase [Rhodospirillaceae bacterium]|jgi:pimeloyl-ACP methyl ester carboxylesterase|nr:alpha/beta hydrolase [Rhodospirillaceae bacterium]MBT5239075.1 alpha/beta hydrolase [Rhodospirillaceae bacterium]MBT5565343.1 alpha/beta hydrolase [Rhodospirillaceae bacterium]
MTNRIISRSSSVVAAACLATVLATSAGAGEPLGRGTSIDDWAGWGIMSGGKGYVATPMGQVHYRDIGPRDSNSTIVLLHQSPMSMIQFAEVQNAFAEMGIRAITIDRPGYGLSDLPPEQPTIGEYADNIIHVLDHVNVDKVAIAGHHTGAQVAAAFAANHADRVTSIVMHGAAQLTQEEADVYLAGRGRDRTPVADGSHLSGRYGAQAETDSQAILDAKTWLTITEYIQGPDIGHWAAFHYDMLPDLLAIKVPGLVLSDALDPVQVMDKRVAFQHRPDFKYIEFSKGDLLQFMAEPKRWAEIVADFMATVDEQDTARLDR